jgi:hypothetical protein
MHNIPYYMNYTMSKTQWFSYILASGLLYSQKLLKTKLLKQKSFISWVLAINISMLEIKTEKVLIFYPLLFI